MLPGAPLLTAASSSSSLPTLPSHCFLKISIAGSESNTVVIKLNTEVCPKTCRNFVALCSSSARAMRKQQKSERTYRGTEFHRIIPKFMVQGGDFANFDGSGGGCYESGGTFPDESFQMKHNSEGIVSMANRGKDTNGSQFFITLAKTPHLDGKHVAFGKVVSGMNVIKDMAKVETEEGGRPILLQRIVVTDCGVGIPPIPHSDKKQKIADDSDDGERMKQKKRKKKKKKRHYYSSSSSSSSYSSESDPSKEGRSKSHSQKRKRRSSRDKRRKKYHKHQKRRNSDPSSPKRKDDDDHHRRHSSKNSSRRDRDDDSPSSKKRRRHY